MKKKTTLLKSLLVAAAMIAGVNGAWADTFNPTPSETTIVKGNGAQEGTTANADANFYDAEATSWLCTQANISGGKLNNQNSGYEGSRVVITKFDLSTLLAGMNVQKATLSFRSVCTVSGKNSNVIVSSLGSTDWDATTVTWNSLDKSVTQISEGTGKNVKTTAVTLSEDVTDLLKNDEDKIVAFAIYTYTAREQKISDIVLEIEAVDAASSADVTLRYVDGEGTELKSEVVVGSANNTLTLTDEQKANFTKDGQKYIYVSDNSGDVVVAKDGTSVITLTYRQAENWTYNINAVDGEGTLLQVLHTATAPEGEKINVGYSSYINVDGTIWSTGKTYSNDSKGFTTSITVSENNATKNITYSNKGIDNVVYFSEGENISGMSVCNTSNAGIRSSNAAAAYAPSDVNITNLPAGKYRLYVICYDAQKTPNSTWTFKAGEETIASINCTTINYWEAGAVDFTLNNSSDITIAKAGGNSIGIDLLYIVKTGDIETATVTSAGWATFVPTANVTIPDGVEAYYVSAVSTTATLTQVETAIPAGAPVLLKAAEGTYTFTQAASAAAIDGNLLKISDGEAMNVLVLYNGDKGVGFYNWTDELPAGKVYLDVPDPGRDFIGLSFGEATGINAVESAKENGAVYNLAGQRVAQPTRGLYIVNGKKVIVK